ncbi:MAG: NAD-dependent epimerase/dehydratase family protein [Spirochaetia bacterium]|jgi:GDP-L-fucose synthase
MCVSYRREGRRDVSNNAFKAEFIYDNLMISTKIIHASRGGSGIRKFLNLGNSCIYPKFALQPLKGDYLLSALLEPTNEDWSSPDFVDTLN